MVSVLFFFCIWRDDVYYSVYGNTYLGSKEISPGKINGIRLVKVTLTSWVR